MLAALSAAGLADVRLDLCHVGVLAALLAQSPVASRVQEELFAALASKDVPALRAITADLPAAQRDAINLLPSLYGGVEVLARARAELPALPAIGLALDDLAALAEHAAGASVNIDLADLRGYHYHSGVMFAAYVAGIPNAVARGGRYDKIGEAFGRARPATGFSMDLREVAGISPVEARAAAIHAPWSGDAKLREAIAALRAAGEIVIQSLPGHPEDLEEFAYDRQLLEEGGRWIVRPRKASA
jgi:ATP phosphoribosyltransferase regulatory subunit